MEAIQRDKGGNPADCMLDLLSKWTTNQAGTGMLPRTWQTVVEAVQLSGDRVLAQNLAQIHGARASITVILFMFVGINAASRQYVLTTVAV